MSNALITMQDMGRMAEAVAKSGLFGVKTADQAMALMLVAQAEGRHPAMAARDYDIIQGRPAKKTEAMLRDFLENQGKVEWHTLDDTVADATFQHPAGGTVRIEWTLKRAAAAGLASRDMWKKYPRQMLRSRCVSEGIRTVCPMATSGMYVPEEVRDFAPEKTITPTSGAEDRVAVDRLPIIDEVVSKVHEFLAAGSIADAVVTLDDNDFDADERVFAWTKFDSKQRSAMKKEMAKQKAERDAKTLPPAIENAAPQPTPVPADSIVGGEAAGAAPVINEKQHRRLEARINEVKASRDDMKAYVKKTWGVEHLNELTQDQYDVIDAMLDKKAAKLAPKSDGGIIDMEDSQL
jgi:hypothetical protein